jgi:hypothetical protein
LKDTQGRTVPKTVQNCSNPEKLLCQNGKSAKKAACKYQKTNDLKNTLKKD